MKRRRLKFSDYYHDIIIKEIAAIYNVDKDRIFLGSRKKNIIFAKRLYIYVLREMFGLTLKEIAEVTNLHHASVIHHSRQFEFFYKNYIQDTENFERVESMIIEVEIDEEIAGLEQQLDKINKSLTKLYKINKLKNERQERESLLTE
jgi:transcriptional regulator with XRE-family HTH domain